MEIYRHGDVLLKRVDLPKGAKEVFKGKEFVAQEGEVTGHMHRIKGPEFRVLLDEQDRYFEFLNEVTITHEEHKPLTINPGTYIQIQEREKDWFSQTIRQIID